MNFKRKSQNNIEIEMRVIFLTFLLSWGIFISPVFPQEFPHDIPEYNFVHLSENQLDFPGDSASFQNLYSKFDEVIFNGKGQVNIMHMGGSHIQAGVFSSSMRTKLQTIEAGLNSYRGFLFPFRVARTNNPSNYQVSYSGYWDYCKNTERKKDCTLGLSGMSVTTHDSLSSIKIKFNEAFPQSEFTSLLVYCETDSMAFNIDANTEFIKEKIIHDGYIEFIFNSEQDSLMLSIEKRENWQKQFTLYGLQFGNKLPGFAYHAIGVNGASVPSYLRCDLLENHVATVKPDLVIFSIGINDAYGTRFSPSQFKENYRQLINKIKRASPQVAILFTTNNDSYYRRRYVNRNGLLVEKAMYELAKEYDAGVWNLFSIMGGLGSIVDWQNYGLAKSDKVHFTSEGYELAGSMLFSALIKSYEYHIKNSQNLTN